MKKIFTLVAILMTIGVATFAADRPKKGKISITSNTYGNVFVKIDGQRYNLDRSEFVLNSVKPGNHRIEIYKVERGGLFGNVKTQVLYSNFVNVAPDQMVNLNINRRDDVVIRKSGFDFNDRNDKWDNDRDHNGGYSYGQPQPGRDRDDNKKW